MDPQTDAQDAEQSPVGCQLQGTPLNADPEFKNCYLKLTKGRLG